MQQMGFIPLHSKNCYMLPFWHVVGHGKEEEAAGRKDGIVLSCVWGVGGGGRGSSVSLLVRVTNQSRLIITHTPLVFDYHREDPQIPPEKLYPLREKGSSSCSARSLSLLFDKG